MKEIILVVVMALGAVAAVWYMNNRSSANNQCDHAVQQRITETWSTVQPAIDHSDHHALSEAMGLVHQTQVLATHCASQNLQVQAYWTPMFEDCSNSLQALSIFEQEDPSDASQKQTDAMHYCRHMVDRTFSSTQVPQPTEMLEAFSPEVKNDAHPAALMLAATSDHPRGFLWHSALVAGHLIVSQGAVTGAAKEDVHKRMRRIHAAISREWGSSVPPLSLYAAQVAGRAAKVVVDELIDHGMKVALEEAPDVAIDAGVAATGVVVAPAAATAAGVVGFACLAATVVTGYVDSSWNAASADALELDMQQVQHSMQQLTQLFMEITLNSTNPSRTMTQIHTTLDTVLFGRNGNAARVERAWESLYTAARQDRTDYDNSWFCWDCTPPTMQELNALINLKDSSEEVIDRLTPLKECLEHVGDNGGQGCGVRFTMNEIKQIRHNLWKQTCGFVPVANQILNTMDSSLAPIEEPHFCLHDAPAVMMPSQTLSHSVMTGVLLLSVFLSGIATVSFRSIWRRRRETSEKTDPLLSSA